jgi:coenzyme PQQ precursor peptide PqqA
MWKKPVWKNLAIRIESCATCQTGHTSELVLDSCRNLGHDRSVRAVAPVRGFDYSYIIAPADWPELGEIMEWTTPAFEEICLNCEINSYASAKLQ